MPERFRRFSKKRRILALLFVVLIILTIAFIWFNSLQSPEKSMKRSGAAEEIVRPVVLSIPVKEWHSDGMITFITRKLAHFTEYFLLGVELMALALILRPDYRMRSVWLFLFAVFIASADEALQLTNGRGAAVADVLLDLSGTIAGLLAVKVLAHFMNKEKTRRA